MDTETFLLELDEAMQKAAEFVSSEMSSIRTGKASPALLDNISVTVESYGTTMPIKQLAPSVNRSWELPPPPMAVSFASPFPSFPKSVVLSW
jgi:ribosome recycling factor